MATVFQDWLDRYEGDGTNPTIPASTVVLLRDSTAGLETLMLRRNSKLSFAEGMWVFPGGRIDEEDHSTGPDASRDEYAAACAAAVREAAEEADVSVDPDSLIHYAHWLPPIQAPKRFSTWFFLAPTPPGPAGDVTVDQGEIMEHQWLSPAATLELHRQRTIELLPPTWMTLHDLQRFATVEEAVSTSREEPVMRFCTRMLKTEAGLAAAWEDDIAYESGDAVAPGNRHRLIMAEDGWILEHGPFG